ncbi:hypothetical protein [Pseudomonas mucidolens]|uniref:hypothetical protein n=1 Tax=Pseudomonas mucidolens TaxID=46679 RepID=UPI0030D8EF66
MQLRFYSLAHFTALLCLALALVWGFRPDLLLWLWSVQYSEVTGLVARRNAMLFLAIGIMFYRLRHALPSPTRNAVSSGFSAGCLGLAALGVIEWLNGHAGPGILLAVFSEITLGLAFIQAQKSVLIQSHTSP